MNNNVISMKEYKQRRRQLWSRMFPPQIITIEIVILGLILLMLSIASLGVKK